MRSVHPGAGGVHRGEVRLVEDEASLDNRLYFAVTLDQQIPLAIVKPRLDKSQARWPTTPFIWRAPSPT